MQANYTIEEVREIVEAHRDGESLEDLETRMAGQWLDHCRRAGVDPAVAIREAAKGLKGVKRD